MNTYEIYLRYRSRSGDRSEVVDDVVGHATHGDLGLFEIKTEDIAILIPLDTIERIEVPVFPAPPPTDDDLVARDDRLRERAGDLS